MRFHNLYEETQEEQQCDKNGLQGTIAKICPEANLIVESKGELAVRSPKMGYYGTNTDKPNSKINLAKEWALHG